MNYLKLTMASYFNLMSNIKDFFLSLLIAFNSLNPFHYYFKKSLLQASVVYCKLKPCTLYHFTVLSSTFHNFKITIVYSACYVTHVSVTLWSVTIHQVVLWIQPANHTSRIRPWGAELIIRSTVG